MKCFKIHLEFSCPSPHIKEDLIADATVKFYTADAT